jgi:hypothetical protein
MVRFNAKIGKYELIDNGKVVARGSENYMKHRAKQLGITLSGQTKGQMQTAAIAETPVVKSEFSVTERFDFIQTFVKLISKKSLNSLIITGDGGLGKTHTVIATLKTLGLREETIGEYDGDFVVIKGFSTAKGLYRSLWENNGKIIIFDDADSVHKDPIGANILKGALDSGEKRVISWNAEFSVREELPNRFEFYGRVIFISNLSLQKFPQPLLSRSMKVDLTLNTEEKLDRIDFVLSEINVDSSDKNEVMSFLRKYANKITDLNVRSALSVLKLQQSLGEGWDRIALYSVTA